ncbi:hypothetical protein ACRQ5Q_09950 [Bradyrhizobium sp. PMVTL-01]|uniref:hypothetical protein n=1 Tax=Bradyrhizobium sp. PMVTL-01 TaxID=3434999 RepID=UPI003F70424E
MTELKPNMTFHLMLGNWIEEDFGYVISQTLCVTETGAEALTRHRASFLIFAKECGKLQMSIADGPGATACAEPPK